MWATFLRERYRDGESAHDGGRGDGEELQRGKGGVELDDKHTAIPQVEGELPPVPMNKSDRRP